MKATQISFSSGEISPEMQGRIDVRQYQYGLATCRNFIVRPQGVLDRRVGMRYAGAAYSDSYKSRLIPFKFNDTEAYAIELSHQRGRIWKDGSLVTWATPKGGSIESVDIPSKTLTFASRHGLSTGDNIQLIGPALVGATATVTYQALVIDSRTISIQSSGSTVTLSGSLSGTLRVFLDSEVPSKYRGSLRTAESNTSDLSQIKTTNHYLSAGNVIRFDADSGLSALGFYSTIDYFVVEVVDANHFKVSDRRNGEAITATGNMNTQQWVRRYIKGETVLHDGVGGMTTHGVYRATADVSATAADPVTSGEWELLPQDGTYTFDLPYSHTDLARLTYTQSNDVMTLTHPDYAPLELIRYGLAHWSTQSVTFEPNVATPTLGTPTVDRGAKLKLTLEYLRVSLASMGGVGPTGHIAEFGFGETGPNSTASSTGRFSGAQGLVVGDIVFIEHSSTPSGGSASQYFPADKSGDGYYQVGHVVPEDTLNVGDYRIRFLREDGTWMPGRGSGAPYTATGTRYVDVNVYFASNSASREQKYKVTALDASRSESFAQDTPATASNIIDVAGATNTLTWDAIPGAVRYRVYREFDGLFGLIAETEETTFVDDNSAEEDMSITPPLRDDFLNGANNYARAVSYFEQRRVFGGSNNRPRTLLMTRSGTESDMSYSLPVKDTDRISVTLAAREAAVVRHIVPMQDLMLLTQQGEWRLFTINSDAITPETVAVRQQGEVGANNVQPIMVNNVAAYAAARGGHVRSVMFNQQRQGYLSGDISLRASHLFDNYELTDAAFQQAPYPIMWWVSSSNKLLGCTYIPEEEVMAWHQHDSGTASFESVCVVPEGLQDTTYVVVVRDGVRSIERMVPDVVVDLNDSVFADSAAVRDGYSSTYTGGATITFQQTASYRVGDTVRVTASGVAFSPADIGEFLQVTSGGESYSMEILTAPSGTEVDVRLLRDLPQTVYSATISTWAMATKTVTGLAHLNGQTVQAVEDGSYTKTYTVANGEISLGSPAARVIVGLSYDSDMQTLPQAYQVEGFGQGTSKIVRDAWLRLLNTAGLQVGPSSSSLVTVDSMTTNSLQSGEFETSVPSEWTQSGQMFVRQSLPLPATILNICLLTEIGD
ncbi:MAG: hypothetical protein GOVbin7015_3 [Prokaryotic dsDNA virus sp.]|jgi:hypothetical protein|nr:MAG: hypothetical protein GOVbin7015_3 [Prokaryotic dsDNA virus sp.]